MEGLKDGGINDAKKITKVIVSARSACKIGGQPTTQFRSEVECDKFTCTRLQNDLADVYATT
jgi:hypothetical protein